MKLTVLIISLKMFCLATCLMRWRETHDRDFLWLCFVWGLMVVKSAFELAGEMRRSRTL